MYLPKLLCEKFVLFSLFSEDGLFKIIEHISHKINKLNLFSSLSPNDFNSLIVLLKLMRLEIELEVLHHAKSKYLHVNIRKVLNLL